MLHAQAPTADRNQRPRISGLYAELAALCASPIIELTARFAVGHGRGPGSGARHRWTTLRMSPRSKPIHLLGSVRGDLLRKLGRHAEARAPRSNGGSTCGQQA